MRATTSGARTTGRAMRLALPAAIGVVAGLRSMTAPALLVWAARQRLLRIGGSSLASMAVGSVAGKLTDVAFTELLVDKLPLAPDRTKPGPLAWRALSGAACGAGIATAIQTPTWQGAALGAAGAVGGAVCGRYARKKAAHRMGRLSAGFLEDAFAVLLGAAVVWQASRVSSARR